MEQIWLWLWWWVFDPTRFILGFVWISIVLGICIVEWRRRRWGPQVPQADPMCPTCGYLVVGLAGQVCPECGTDVGRAGVVRDDDPRTRPAGKMALWAILLAIPAIYAWRHVERRLPTLSEGSWNCVFTRPSSNAFSLITVSLPFRRWNWPRQQHLGRPWERLELRLVTNQGAERIFRTSLSAPLSDEYARKLESRAPLAAATQPSDLHGVFDVAEMYRWVGRQQINVEDPQAPAGELTACMSCGNAVCCRLYAMPGPVKPLWRSKNRENLIAIIVRSGKNGALQRGMDRE